MSILELRDVTMSFGALTILKGVDLTIERGERHAIIGPNGAGKSTLMNILSGKLTPSRGRALYDGRDITGLASWQIARLGIGRAFQIINTFPHLTVFENVQSAALSRAGIRFDCFHLLSRRKAITSAAEAVLEQVGLSKRRDVKANVLAYGEQRALEIALCLALEPDLMLLDEPCAGLNAEDTNAEIALIRNVSDGRTLVMIEHDMEVVFGLADRVSVLHEGRVLITGRPDEVRSSADVQRAYLGTKFDVHRS